MRSVRTGRSALVARTEATRRLGGRVLLATRRALRGGIAVATLALTLAVGVGLAGLIFGEQPQATVHGSGTAHSSIAALRSLLVGDDDHDASADAPRARPYVRPAAEVEVPVDVDVQREPVALSVAAPDLLPGMRASASVSFYYCIAEADSAHQGDGGGFCGAMRNGQTVFPGAAACDAAYLGQRFRIEGDPTERTYVCADTGSAVAGQHRDIWFYDAAAGWAWAKQTGRRVVIEILPAS